MTTTHPKPGEVIDTKIPAPVEKDLQKTTLIKTDRFELVRVNLSNGKVIPEHKAPGEITVQCLTGRIAFTSAGSTVELSPGQLLYLDSAALHSVRCLDEATLLVTKIAK